MIKALGLRSRLQICISRFGLKPMVFTKSTKALPPDQQIPSVSTKDHLPYFDDNLWIDKFIRHQKIAKLQSTYVGVEMGHRGPTGFWQYLWEDRIHPSYLLHRTVTGRTASISKIISRHLDKISRFAQIWQMSVVKCHVNNGSLRGAVLSSYAIRGMTIAQIADELRLTAPTVSEILQIELSSEEFRVIKARNYAKSKTGFLNPQKGRRAANYVGECDDGYGYKTEVVNGRRYFKHRIVVAQALEIGPDALPEWLKVHHINKDKINNSLDNLALVTNRGHKKIHLFMDQRLNANPNEISYKTRRRQLGARQLLCQALGISIDLTASFSAVQIDVSETGNTIENWAFCSRRGLDMLEAELRRI